MFLVGLNEVKMRLLICTNDIRSARVLSRLLVRICFIGSVRVNTDRGVNTDGDLQIPIRRNS